MYLIGFPLLIIPFAIYNMIAFLTPGRELDRHGRMRFPLMSGADWTVTTEDIAADARDPAAAARDLQGDPDRRALGRRPYPVDGRCSSPC